MNERSFILGYVAAPVKGLGTERWALAPCWMRAHHHMLRGLPRVLPLSRRNANAPQPLRYLLFRRDRARGHIVTARDGLFVRGSASVLLSALAAVTPFACGESGLPTAWVEPNTGMSFVLVDSGSFAMGLRPDEPGDLRLAPLHHVRISRPFYLGRFEVTQGEWSRVMGTRSSRFPDCGDRCPVETVTWPAVQEFLRRLQAMDPGERFRLPTEAEWEYVCRAGTDMRYGGADTLTPELANYDARIPFDGVAGDSFVGHPMPVGSYPPNPWGVSDLQGNVWEWSQDEYCPYDTGSVTDPAQSCGTDTIAIRGGSWYFSANAARCGRRYTHDRHDKGFSLGFRVLREAPEE